MPNADHTAAHFHNRLLQHLDVAGEERFRSVLEPVSLKAQEVLYHAGEHIDQIYFPESAVICMLTVMADGETIESSTVGREGASWISASFDQATMPCQTMVAVGGEAWKIGVPSVEREIQLNGEFHGALSQYSHALLIAAFRTTACNGLHNIHQRAARWMLGVLDRTQADRFKITHEFLAELLGVRRSTVTDLIADFRDKGLVESTRGVIEIVKRKELEEVACECYAIVKQNYEMMAYIASSRI